MTTLEILFLFGLLGTAPFVLILALRGDVQHRAALVAALAAGFWGFSLVTIAREGLLGFLPNHVANLWGTQVWYDLVICLTVALTFVVPRAKAAGMNVLAWTAFAGLTASLGLLPMVARLFWLESRAGAAANPSGASAAAAA